MKNIIKIALVMLTAISFSFANAGELTVTGSAKASYVVVGSDSATGTVETPKSLGVANEFNLGASGETDGGIAWGYNINIDGATTQDDGGLWLSNSLGKVAINISQGGLELSKAAALTASVDRAASAGFGEGMFEGYSIGDMNNISYSLPAGLLPFGIAATVAYAPSTISDDNQSVNDLLAAQSGATTAAGALSVSTGFAQTSNNAGSALTQYQVTAAPIAGLTIGASYDDYKTTSSLAQKPEGGAWYAKYAIGNAQLAYGKAYYAMGVLNGSAIDSYETIVNTNMAALVAVNDQLSVSYQIQKSNAASTVNTTADVELEATQIAAAYTVGGLTFAVSQNAYDNVNYISNKDAKSTVFNLSVAF